MASFVANEFGRLADAGVGTSADYLSLRVAADLIRTAARHVDAAAAHDAGPAMLTHRAMDARERWAGGAGQRWVAPPAHAARAWA